MPVPAREAENAMEQKLLLCQLCRAKVAANTRKHLMTGSLHCLSLLSPKESLRCHGRNNSNTKNTSLSALWQRAGAEALGSQCWGRGCSFLGAGNSGANPALCKCLSSSFPARTVPKLPGAASGPCWTQTFPQFPPTSPLLPASSYAPSKTLHPHPAFGSKLRACLGHTSSKESVAMPFQLLVKWFPRNQAR